MTNTDPCSNDGQHDVILCGQPPSHDVQLGTRAVVYLRVSALQPAATDRSIAAQREACRRKAAELGFSLIDDVVVDERPARHVITRDPFRRVRAQVRRRLACANSWVAISQGSHWPGRVRRRPCNSSRPIHQGVS